MQFFSLINLFSPGVNAKGEQVFLKDIWPTRDEIQAVERQYVIPGMFKEVYQKIEVRSPSALPSCGQGTAVPLWRLCRHQGQWWWKLEEVTFLSSDNEGGSSQSFSPVTSIFTYPALSRSSQIWTRSQTWQQPQEERL